MPPGPRTPAVLGADGVAIETRSAALAGSAGRVAPAIQADAGHVVALVENEVGVRVPVAVALLAEVARGHGVSIVTGSTPM